MAKLNVVVNGEYKLLPTKRVKGYGIEGKLAWVRKEGKRKGFYWVQVDSDVYELSTKDFHPLIVSGMHSANIPKIIGSDTMKNVEIRLSISKEEMFKLSAGRSEVAYYNTRKDGMLTCIILKVENYMVNLVPPYFFSDGIFTTFLPHIELAERKFTEATGKNCFDVLSLATLLELSMCDCGSKYQFATHDLDSQKSIVRCVNCSKLLYSNDHSEGFTLPEELKEELSEQVYESLTTYYNTARNLREKYLT